MASKFGSAPQDKCPSCSTTVYPTERLVLAGVTFHKSCAKCTVCKASVGLGNFATRNGALYCKTHYLREFAESGGKYEPFHGSGGVAVAAKPPAAASGSAAADAPVKPAPAAARPSIVVAEMTSFVSSTLKPSVSPTMSASTALSAPAAAAPSTGGASFKFKSNTETCPQCSETVYPTDRVVYEGLAMHKRCFKCCHCNTTLSLSNIAYVNKKMYCKPHFMQLFKESGGKYNTLGAGAAKADPALAAAVAAPLPKPKPIVVANATDSMVANSPPNMKPSPLAAAAAAGASFASTEPAASATSPSNAGGIKAFLTKFENREPTAASPVAAPVVVEPVDPFELSDDQQALPTVAVVPGSPINRFHAGIAMMRRGSSRLRRHLSAPNLLHSPSKDDEEDELDERGADKGENKHEAETRSKIAAFLETASTFTKRTESGHDLRFARTESGRELRLSKTASGRDVLAEGVTLDRKARAKEEEISSDEDDEPEEDVHVHFEDDAPAESSLMSSSTRGKLQRRSSSGSGTGRAGAKHVHIEGDEGSVSSPSIKERGAAYLNAARAPGRRRRLSAPSSQLSEGLRRIGSRTQSMMRVFAPAKAGTAGHHDTAEPVGIKPESSDAPNIGDLGLKSRLHGSVRDRLRWLESLSSSRRKSEALAVHQGSPSKAEIGSSAEERKLRYLASLSAQEHPDEFVLPAATAGSVASARARFESPSAGSSSTSFVKRFRSHEMGTSVKSRMKAFTEAASLSFSSPGKSPSAGPAAATGKPSALAAAAPASSGLLPQPSPVSVSVQDRIHAFAASARGAGTSGSSSTLLGSSGVALSSHDRGSLREKIQAFEASNAPVVKPRPSMVETGAESSPLTRARASLAAETSSPPAKQVDTGALHAFLAATRSSGSEESAPAASSSPASIMKPGSFRLRERKEVKFGGAEVIETPASDASETSSQLSPSSSSASAARVLVAAAMELDNNKPVQHEEDEEEETPSEADLADGTISLPSTTSFRAENGALLSKGTALGAYFRNMEQARRESLATKTGSPSTNNNNAVAAESSAAPSTEASETSPTGSSGNNNSNSEDANSARFEEAKPGEDAHVETIEARARIPKGRRNTPTSLRSFKSSDTLTAEAEEPQQ